ncbi:hypothetical protein [Tateyamaria sp. ANG-S1]|uniref:hypothetical protein n=1 Tax=Tateyamaria sp. ANG-S1 TaxID=1577905 RepID=UPI00057C369F|nr:hypothetical protein [Tateyamaria sp. ANG-S1]KIC51983.1 hypothetical protein RA29_01475 [Tateyamaria sp. ANG-S1]
MTRNLLCIALIAGALTSSLAAQTPEMPPLVNQTDPTQRLVPKPTPLASGVRAAKPSVHLGPGFREAKPSSHLSPNVQTPEVKDRD